MATKLVSTSGAITAILDGSYSTIRRVGNRAVFLGDSNTFGYNQSGENYPDATCLYSKGQIVKVKNAGVSGQTTAQIAARVQADVIALNPNICFVMAGTNDITDSVNLLAVENTYKTGILDPLLAAGITPIICSVLPNNYSTARAGAVIRLNSWLRRQAATLGVPYVDFHGAFVDPATGGWLTTYHSAEVGDTLHANAVGYRVMGKIAADTVANFLPRIYAPIVNDNIDVNNLWDNGCFLTDATADSKPDGFGIGVGTAAAGLSYALEAATGYKGNSWKLTLANPDGDLSRGLTRTITASGRFAVGDRLALAAMVDIDSNTLPAGGGYKLEIVWTGGSGGTQTLIRTGVQITNGVAYAEVTVPTGATAVEVRHYCIGAAAETHVWRLGQFTAYNLTTQNAV